LCLKQIKEAKERYPQLETLDITDDCPTFDISRFKTFLKMLSSMNTGCELVIDNVRANLLDEEMIQLYIAAGGKNICLGTETGDPEIFKTVNKGESLQNILDAAKLIRQYGLVLGLCFVIGLPGDNLKRHRKSLALAKALKPDYIFWNMCIPWPGTPVHQWYKTHGTIGDLRNFSTLVDPKGDFKTPVCATREFPRKDRIRAWLVANMETHCYFKRVRDVGKLFLLSLRYGLLRSFVTYFGRCFVPLLLARFKSIFERTIASLLWGKRGLSAVEEEK
jgi:radical SAM superfamily enzyme YgiQ (UPF0313 family)